MPVCRYFLQGRCQYGDRCYNEHPPNHQNQNQRHSLEPLNPFHSSSRATVSNQGTSFFQNATSSQKLPSDRDAQTQFKLDKTTILNDLGKERPLWALSCYGPGKDAPRQLFGAFPREQSFEEMRLRHMSVLASSGSLKTAMSEAQNLVRDAERQNQAAMNDVGGAMKYICDGEHIHPNRLDTCAQSSSAAQTLGLGGIQQPMLMPQPPLVPQSTSILHSMPNSLNDQNNSAATSFSNPLRTSLDPVSHPPNPIHASPSPSPSPGSFPNPFRTTTASGLSSNSLHTISDAKPGSQPNSQRDQRGKLTTWHGRPVTYKEDDQPGYQDSNGAWCRIWFPDGPPVSVPSPTLEPLSPEQAELDNNRIAAYADFREKGFFEAGKLPELAPKRTSCQWGF